MSHTHGVLVLEHFAFRAVPVKAESLEPLYLFFYACRCPKLVSIFGWQAAERDYSALLRREAGNKKPRRSEVFRKFINVSIRYRDCRNGF